MFGRYLEAERAHFERLDGAHQRMLDEADHELAAENALLEAETLQDLEDAGWRPEHLETKLRFDRYTLGHDTSTWVCPECGTIDIEPFDGCDICGFGTADE